MTDFEYILHNAKLFHYKGWEEGELQKCLGMLPTLSREELAKLYRSKWVDDKLRKTVFKVLFAENILEIITIRYDAHYIYNRFCGDIQYLSLLSGGISKADTG